MRTLKILLVISVIFGLAACSSLPKQDYYKNNRMIKPIKIPAGLSSSKIKDYYPVPAAKIVGSAKPDDLLPPGVNKQ